MLLLYQLEAENIKMHSYDFYLGLLENKVFSLTKPATKASTVALGTVLVIMVLTSVENSVAKVVIGLVELVDVPVFSASKTALRILCSVVMNAVIWVIVVET